MATIEELENLNNLCNQALEAFKSEQDDSSLINILQSEYKLTKRDMNAILKVVDAKKGASNSDKNESEWERKLIGTAIIADVNPYLPKSTTFCGIKKLKQRTAAKKIKLK